MNKILLVAAYCITLFYTSHAQYQTHWGKSTTPSGSFNLTDMCIDNSGNVYTVGIFNGTMDLNPGAGTHTVTGPAAGGSSYHTFIQKLDASGNFVWGKVIPVNDAYSFRIGIAVDNQENVYCSGSFAGTVDFDPGAGIQNRTQLSNNRDRFLLKLNAAGNFTWVKQWGASGNWGVYGGQLTIDNNGNILTLGQFTGTIDFDPGTGVSNLTSTSISNSCIMSLNSNGDFLWARYLPTLAKAIKHTSTNDILVTGHFGGTIDFDLGTGVHNVTAGGTQDGYVLKLNNNGNFVSVVNFAGNIYPREVNVDVNDNILVCGYFNDAVDLDPGAGVYNITSTTTSAFLVKLSPTGAFLWGKKPTSSNYSDGLFVDTDSNGNVYMVGGMNDSTAFNPGVSPALFTNGGYDAFIVRFLPNGTFNSAVGFGGNLSDVGFAVAVNKPNGEVYVNGTFNSTMNIDFNGGNMPLTTSSNAYFVLKVSPECTPVQSIDTHSECAPFAWIDGNTYYANNTTATHTIANGAANGCDSIVTLNLTINQPTNSSSTVTECGQYTWAANNQTYTTSGTYTHVIPNANNCDSTITLNLTINQPTSSSSTVTECGQYTWAANNQTYTTSGTYTHVIPNASNCDSTITLNLTINQPTNSSSTVTECGQYTWATNNQTYTASGVYTHVIPNATNCDSTITLNLTINTVNAVVTSSGLTLIANPAGATYQWIDCDNNDAPISGATAQLFTPTQNGNYAVTITTNGCTETSDCVPVNFVGVETLEQNDWIVYPNPGNGLFTLKGTISGNTNISIMNVLGQVINAPINTSGDVISFDLTTEPAGMYLIKIELSNQSHIIQVIKK